MKGKWILCYCFTELYILKDGFCFFVVDIFKKGLPKADALPALQAKAAERKKRGYLFQDSLFSCYRHPVNSCRRHLFLSGRPVYRLAAAAGFSDFL